MSQRSIIEINHDLCHRIKGAEQGLEVALSRALASGSDENWETLKQFGIRRITQCHHSEKRRVIVGGRDYEIG